MVDYLPSSDNFTERTKDTDPRGWSPTSLPWMRNWTDAPPFLHEDPIKAIYFPNQFNLLYWLHA